MSNVVKDGTIPSVAFYDEPYDVTVEVLKVDADDGTTPLREQPLQSAHQTRQTTAIKWQRERQGKMES